eukprot:scaffold511605_cov47-Prasinocladus_malaysianus.AAC.1
MLIIELAVHEMSLSMHRYFRHQWVQDMKQMPRVSKPDLAYHLVGPRSATVAMGFKFRPFILPSKSGLSGIRGMSPDVLKTVLQQCN